MRFSRIFHVSNVKMYNYFVGLLMGLTWQWVFLNDGLGVKNELQIFGQHIKKTAYQSISIYFTKIIIVKIKMLQLLLIHTTCNFTQLHLMWYKLSEKKHTKFYSWFISIVNVVICIKKIKNLLIKIYVQPRV
jgi:hypothetical protein